MIRQIIVVLIVLPLMLLAAELDRYTVVVYGSAKIEADADLATIVYYAVETGASMEEAFQELRQTLESTHKKLTGYGVTEKNIYVTSFNSGENRYGSSLIFKSDDFRASTNVTLMNVPVDQVEKIILELGRQEIKNIVKVSYSLKSDTEIKSKAREMALDAARNKALEMTADMGMKLGSVLVIEELPEGRMYNGISVVGEKAYNRELANPFNQTMTLDDLSDGDLSSFYPQKIAIKQHVRVVFRLPQ